jgi:hypothetical protein
MKNNRKKKKILFARIEMIFSEHENKFCNQKKIIEAKEVLIFKYQLNLASITRILMLEPCWNQG